MGRIRRAPSSIDTDEDDESSSDNEGVSESDSDSGNNNAVSKRGENSDTRQAAASPDRAEMKGTTHQTKGREYDYDHGHPPFES